MLLEAPKPVRQDVKNEKETFMFKGRIVVPEKVRTERLLCGSLESGTGLKGEFNNTQP